MGKWSSDLPALSFVATVGFGSLTSGVLFFLGLLYYYGGWGWLLWCGLFCSWALFALCCRVTTQASEDRRRGGDV